MTKRQQFATHDAQQSTSDPTQENNTALIAAEPRPVGLDNARVSQYCLDSAAGNPTMELDMDFDAFDPFDDSLWEWDADRAMNVSYWPLLSELEQLPSNL